MYRSEFVEIDSPFGPQGPPPPTVLFTPMTSACNPNITWPSSGGQAPVPSSAMSSPLPHGVGMVAALQPAPNSVPTPNQAIGDPIVQKVAWQKGNGDVLALGEARAAYAQAKRGESAWALGSTSSPERSAFTSGSAPGAPEDNGKKLALIVVGIVVVTFMFMLMKR